MREIGTMWQIGVLAGKPCENANLVQNGSFSAFWHYKNKEGRSRGLDVNWYIPSTCLDASRKWFSTGIYSINRASGWLWPENEETPENDQKVHGFQVRTPICHIVPVSRAYGGGGLFPLRASFSWLIVVLRPGAFNCPGFGVSLRKKDPSSRNSYGIRGGGSVCQSFGSVCHSFGSICHSFGSVCHSFGSVCHISLEIA